MLVEEVGWTILGYFIQTLSEVRRSKKSGRAGGWVGRLITFPLYSLARYGGPGARRGVAHAAPGHQPPGADEVGL